MKKTDKKPLELENKNTKTVIWKLEAGGKEGQESYDQKRKKGEEYIQSLKDSGQNIIEVIDDGKQLRIILEDK